MPKVKQHLILAMALFAAAHLCGCLKRTEFNSGMQGIVYCSESNPATFNPQLVTSSSTSDATAYQIYDRLLEFDTESSKIIPSLASSWHISQNGLVYTFQLRKNVQFHSNVVFTPSRNFNADDVLFSFNRWRDPEHPFHRVSGGNYPYFASLELNKIIATIKRINSYRIEIHLSKPDSSFLATLATDFAIILSAEFGHYLLSKGVPEIIDQQPIGTGPFKFKQHQKDRYIRYAKNDNYWRDIEIVDQLIFDITPSSALRIAKLMTGECDIISLPAHSELSIIKKRSNLVLDERPGLNVGFWAFNSSRSPFDNPAIRQALAMAIDRSTLLEAVYFDHAVQANGIIPPRSWAYQQNLQGPQYNPVLARELLKKNGIREGLEMTIWAASVERKYNPNAIRTAELIQGYLKNVGISATIVSYEWNAFRRKLALGEYDSVVLGWSADNGDPDNFYRPLLSCAAIESNTNRAKWCSKKFEELINEAITYTDETTRAALYQTANAIIADQMPLVPIAHAYRYQAYRDNIKGLKINPFGGIRFAGVYKAL